MNEWKRRNEEITNIALSQNIILQAARRAHWRRMRERNQGDSWSGAVHFKLVDGDRGGR